MKNRNNQIDHDPARIERKPRYSVEGWFLIILPVMAFVLLLLALPSLIASDDGVIGKLKVLAAASAAALTTYAVNKFSNERGAPLTVRGYWFAGVFSVVAIAATGLGVFAATYSGLVRKDVTILRLEDHAAALRLYVAEQNKIALQSSRLSAPLRAFGQELAGISECEVKSSCLSGRPDGGRGPVARVVNQANERLQAIIEQVDRGQAAQKATLDRINTLLTRFSAEISDASRTESERWIVLQGLDSQIGQQLTLLSEASGLSMLANYAAELRGGVTIAGREEAARKLNAQLRIQGDGLKTIIDGMSVSQKPAPQFPRPTSISDTLSFYQHFLPIFALCFVSEVILPITLFVFTTLTLAWAAYQQEPPKPTAPHHDDAYIREILAPFPRRVDANDAAVRGTASDSTTHAPSLRRPNGALRHPDT